MKTLITKREMEVIQMEILPAVVEVFGEKENRRGLLKEKIRLSVKHRLQKIFNAIHSELLLIDKSRKDILEEFGKLDEKLNKYVFETPEAEAEAEKKYRELIFDGNAERKFEIEVQEIDINCLLTDSDGKDIVLEGDYNISLIEKLFCPQVVESE